MATIPAFAQADGKTNPLPVSAYVVIIDKTDAFFFSLINRLPIMRVVLRVPSRTMSTIVLTALGESRSLGLIKFPAALLMINVGSSPSELTHASRLFSI